MQNGALVISLDFELFWGVTGSKTIANYKNNLLNVEEVVPRLIDLFELYGISATWATVGFLLFENGKELKGNIPNKLPDYNNKSLSTYELLFKLKDDNENQKCFFNKEILEILLEHPSQEFASHSFSHLYSKEEGITDEDFISDVKHYNIIARNKNINLESYVFPRNQVLEKHVEILKDHGFKSYRGNEANALYSKSSIGFRVKRLIDNYCSIFGHHTFKIDNNRGITNIPHSLLLRPFSKYTFLNKLQVNRITKAMTYAAKQNEIFHLYWHPHNFGNNVEGNLSILKQILDHFTILRETYAFKSMSMRELAKSEL